jgi:hypothetical protein
MLSPLQKLIRSFPGVRENYLRREMFGNELVAILPAGLVQVAPGAAKLWCVARSLDHPDNGGNGCGIIGATLEEFANWLKRSTRTVWRYLQEAERKGFIHRHWWDEDRLMIEYVGLKPLAKKWGLQSIGAVGMFPLHDIQHARAKAAEIQAEDLQRQSDYKRKEAFGKYAKGAKSAAELLSDSSSSARVSGGERIARGNRLLYLAPHWRPFGGSQKTIGDRIGVSTRTVQNRLSNSWRGERGLELINKAQSAHQVFEEVPAAFLRDYMKYAEESPEQRYVFLGRRVFKVGCNLYSTSVLLRNYRYRKAEYKNEISPFQRMLGSKRSPKSRYTASKEYSKNVLQTSENQPVFSIAPGDTTLDYMVSDSEFKNFLDFMNSLKDC